MRLRGTVGPCLWSGACEVFCKAPNSLTAVLISDCFGFWAFIQDRNGGKTDRSWGMRTSALTELEGSMVKISAGVYRAEFCLSASWWGCALMEMWRTEQCADIKWTDWRHQRQVTEACITLRNVFCRKARWVHAPYRLVGYTCNQYKSVCKMRYKIP